MPRNSPSPSPPPPPPQQQQQPPPRPVVALLAIFSPLLFSLLLFEGGAVPTALAFAVPRLASHHRQYCHHHNQHHYNHNHNHNHNHSYQRRSVPANPGPPPLRGLAEWRDAVPERAAGNSGTNGSGSGSGSRGSGRGRPIPMLPFPSEDVLVRGQSTTIVLREGRHHDLLDECVSGHGSLVGMALLDDDGLLEVMPLCEIGDVDVRAGYGLGVALHVTLRAVGRATIEEVTRMRPTMGGICCELADVPLFLPPLGGVGWEEEGWDGGGGGGEGGAGGGGAGAGGQVGLAAVDELLRDVEATIDDMSRGAGGGGEGERKGGGGGSGSLAAASAAPVPSLRQRYDRAVRLALDAAGTGGGGGVLEHGPEGTGGESKSQSQFQSQSQSQSRSRRGTRSPSYLTAASWAVAGFLPDKAMRCRAMASTSVEERLRLGRRSLLEAKFRGGVDGGGREAAGTGDGHSPLPGLAGGGFE